MKASFEVINMNEIAEIIVKYGTAVAVLAYFIYKDAKFTGRITELIGKVETLLNNLNGKDHADK